MLSSAVDQCTHLFGMISKMLIPDTKPRNRNWTFIGSILIIVLLGIATSVYVGMSVSNNIRQHLLDRANTLGQAITGSAIGRLSGTEADLLNPEYERVKRLLVSIRVVNQDLRFIYINGIRDDILFFYVDSEDPTSEDYSPPGQLYEEATQPMYEVFSAQQDQFEISRDRWGFWASAYAPIKNEVTGNVVALIGLDVPALEYFSTVFAYAALPLLVMFIMLAILIAAHAIRLRERRYIDQKAEFLSIAAHEIRSPLTGIRWATEGILNNPAHPIDEHTRSVLSLVYGNCVGLIHRINTLLNVTALEHGKTMKLEMKPVKIVPVIEHIADDLRLAAAARQVEIFLDPSMTHDITVMCDEEQIRHVFTNLISNGIKYTSPNTNVRISYDHKGEWQELSVSDMGGGMSEDDIEHVFDGYFRTAEARRGHQYGSGIGLYLARKVALLHGGNITVVSTQGRGTVFTLRLRAA